jgi:hypothetical protein
MYLISDTELAALTGVNLQMDRQKLAVCYGDVEYFYLQKLLGVTLLEHYKLAALGTNTLNDKQAQLLPALKRYYAKMIHRELIANSIFDSVNKGNMQNSTADEEAVRLRREKLYQQAEVIKNDILQFIDRYPTAFPQFVADAGVLQKRPAGPICFGRKK